MYVSRSLFSGSVFVSAAALLAVATDLHAQAQAPVTSQLEEVVVTATRREERLQDVPLAVSALSAEQIAGTGFKALSDIQYALPGVYFGSTPNDAGFRLRGVGTAGGFSSSSEQNVGTVVDGVVIPIGNPVASLGDIDRIEVLKGPQGTQFGKNASSGVVSITTRAPNLDKMEGNVFASYGELDERDVHGSISVPFGGGTAAAGLYAFDKEYDGFVNNKVLDEDWGGAHSSGARAKLLWKPNEVFSAQLIGDYSQTRYQGPDQLWTLNRLAPGFDPYFSPPFVNLAALGVTPGFDNEDSAEEYESRRKEDNYGASLELDFSLGGGTLTSITAYRVAEADASNFAIDGSPLARFTAQGYGSKSDFTSEEIRWTSPSERALEYVAGVYASRQRAGLGDGQSAQLRPDPTDQSFIVSISNGIGNAQTTSKSIAAFFDGSFALTDTLKLIGGARYTSDDVDASTYSIIDPAFPPGPSAAGFVVPYGPAARQTGSTSEDNLSGRLGLEFKPSDDLMFYATAARGYLGPTVTFSILTATRSDVAAQTVDDVTIGFKAQFLDRRLTFNGNVFYDDYTDLQTSVFNGLEFVTENAGGLKTKGFEVELAMLVTDGLRANLGYTYSDAYFTDYITACPPSVEIQGPAAIAATCNAPGSLPAEPLYQAAGDKLPGAPRNTVTAGVDYSHSIGASLALDANANYYYRDEVWNSAGDTLTVHPDYQIVNLGFGLGDANGAWRVGVFARNVFDERFQAGLLATPFTNPGGVMNWNTRDGRRTVGVSVSARF
jgi:iron complex outermembrane receptor protein